jgi:hypothetical protein
MFTIYTFYMLHPSAVNSRSGKFRLSQICGLSGREITYRWNYKQLKKIILAIPRIERESEP